MEFHNATELVSDRGREVARMRQFNHPTETERGSAIKVLDTLGM